MALARWYPSLYDIPGVDAPAAPPTVTGRDDAALRARRFWSPLEERHVELSPTRYEGQRQTVDDWAAMEPHERHRRLAEVVSWPGSALDYVVVLDTAVGTLMEHAGTDMAWLWCGCTLVAATAEELLPRTLPAVAAWFQVSVDAHVQEGATREVRRLLEMAESAGVVLGDTGHQARQTLTELGVAP